MRTLIIIILLSISTVANSQYVFDSVQVKKLNLIIEENKFLNVENDSLNNRVNLYKQALSKDELIISIQDSVMAIKERQLKKFEQTPQITQIVKKTGFWTWCGVVVSSVAVGLITGYVLR